MADTTIPLMLSIIATGLSLFSFCGAVWRTWRDRPRLAFYLRKVTFENRAYGHSFNFVQIKISNIGYRPIILKRFIALGRRTMFSMGIDDEPEAIYGVEKQVFPIKIDPGETKGIHPITVDALENNVKEPESNTTFFDPFLYFCIVDSFGRLFPIDVDELRFHLHLTKSHSKKIGVDRLLNLVRTKCFLFNAKRRHQIS